MNLKPLIDPVTGKQTGFERPTNGLFDKDGNFVGEHVEGETVLLANPEAEEAAQTGAMHPATEQ